MTGIAIGIDPIIAQLGPFSLTWHGLFATLGVVLGASLSARLARRTGWPEADLWSLLPWVLVGGLLGARILHVVDNWALYAAEPWTVLLVNEGGIGLLGAIVGGSVAGYLGARRLGVAPAPIADLAAPGLLLGQAIGRIGDVINGEHLARVTDLPWGVFYTHPDSPGPRLPVHPAVAYELIWDLTVLAILLVLRRRARVPGAIYWSYLLLYSVGRFFISFLRLDPVRIAGLQISQVVALLCICAGGFALPYLWRSLRGPVTALRAPPNVAGTTDRPSHLSLG
jgi:phosphatidylglycerol---prolipoprotein diacylglyceryl transferase